MAVKIRHIVEFDDGVNKWTHDLPAGSDLRHPNLGGWAGRIIGPTHNPYWLRPDGSKSKNGPF